MDTDDIFKLPALPKGQTKRKLEAPTHELPDFKSVKLSTDAPAASNGKGKGRAVTIREDTGSSDEEERTEEQTAFAPGGDADYFAEEDGDSGRFFGSGLNDTQKVVLNMMDAGTADGPGEATSQGVRKQLLALEKAINKNRDMRTKYGNDPSKFVDSEFILLEALNALLLLASSPVLSYPILLELSTLNSLADLLSHENTEIAIAVIEVLEEMTDEEVLETEGEDEDEDTDERQEAMRILVEGIVEAGMVDLVISGLERLNEADEAERGGVYHTLGLIENLLSLSPPIATSILSAKSPLIPFLLKRIGAGKAPAEQDQNRYYAGELLSILLSIEVDGVKDARARLAGDVDALLRVLSVYRRRDPSSADELEFMENIFDSICSALSAPSFKLAFLDGEGIELMCLMLKDKKLSKTRAIKTLDHALQGTAGIALCEKFVEMLGLKTLFSAFMGKSAANQKKKSTGTTYEDTEHILSLISSLLTSLASESPSRLRLLAKFVEGDYEKVDRLVELREDVETRVSVAGAEEAEEGLELDEEDLYLEKLEKGLFSLQLIDYIIGWLCMEDDGMRDHIKMLLARRDRSLSDVMRVLIEYRENIGDTPVAEGEEGTVINEGEEQRDILAHLLTYLQSVDT